MSCLRSFCALLAVLAAAQAAPTLTRVYPLGGQRGTEVAIELLGEHLAGTRTIEFDCTALRWVRTTEAAADKLTGVVAIDKEAALGPHIFRAITSEGVTTSLMFNAGQFPTVLEAEPNDLKGQEVQALPVEIQGRLDGAVDSDRFSIRVRAGERWTFDFRSIEYGSSVEAKMSIWDQAGRRVAFNDDRDDFDETPYLDYTFTRDGLYTVLLDQYRGPRGFNFGKNCAYILRITRLGRITYLSPLGARPGETLRLRLGGERLDALTRVWLTPLRRAEHARMTYPYTAPIRFEADPARPAIIGGHGARAVALRIPADAQAGLWKVWGDSKDGVLDGPSVEISPEPAIHGVLSRPGQAGRHPVPARAGETVHLWTLSAQLGLPHLDTVLELRDAAGKLLAENDDVVAGQGSLIGNPDSSVYFTPKEDGTLYATVHDRINRGGESYVYRLRTRNESPGFQLFTTPENLSAPRGGEARLKVHLVREAGFEGEVEVWAEGADGEARGKFRADQRFEPNADGADMIIPEIAFNLRAPPSPGVYPLRVYGRPLAGGPVVEARSSLMIGPLLDSWNFIRRPCPRIEMTVFEPAAPVK